MSTGTTLAAAEAGALLGGLADNTQITRILGLLHDHDQWDAIRKALTRMANHLTDIGAPIDYQRRRRLDYTDLLPDHTWQRICRNTGIPARTPATGKKARCFLFERLSGLPADSYPEAVDHYHFRSRTADFVRNLTPELANALDNYAYEFLATHNICDEPPTWQPPTSLLNGLPLPGGDPADIDINQLHQLIRQDGHTLGEAAECLGTTLDTVRHLLEVRPAPITDADIRGSAYLAAKAAFPPDKLTDLYLRQRISTADIAEQIGVDSRVIALLARDYQIPVRKPGRPLTTSVDRDWLHEQYITQRRTLTELAHETGMTWATMARWAQHHNIPLRRRHGFDSRRTQFTATDIAAAPPILQPALIKIGGLGLLNDFAATATHPTIVRAAENIGIHSKTLANRIKELEQHLGGTLLNRTHNPRLPMTLTPLGQAVLDAVGILRAALTNSGQTEEMPAN